MNTTKERYNQSPEELYFELCSKENGLSEVQILENRKKYGENKLNEKRKNLDL